MKAGGFNAQRFPQPSIEDIDLGTRLTGSGSTILLKKDIQVKHLKQWTFWGLLKTDILNRAIPWTLLILQNRNLPNDLNLSTPQRLCALLSIFAVGLLLAGSILSPTAAITNIPISLMFLILFFGIVSDWPVRNINMVSSPGRRKLLLFDLLYFLIIFLTWISRIPLLIPSIVLILPEIFILHFPLSRFQSFLRFGFTLLITGFALGYAAILFSALNWIYFIATLSLLIIILANLPLYIFFAKARGFDFAFAAVPYHVLYYLYSMAAYAFGNICYLFSKRAETGGSDLVSNSL
jgi:hypothetical protein